MSSEMWLLCVILGASLINLAAMLSESSKHYFGEAKLWGEFESSWSSIAQLHRDLAKKEDKHE